MTVQIVVGILASHGECYDKFKEIWIKNIKYVKQKNIGKQIDFIFIYGGDQDKKIIHSDYLELYVPFKETHRNMLRKTLTFYEYAIEKYGKQRYTNEPFMRCPELFTMRTNLSTLFNFDKLITWMQDIPSKKFFGGSLIAGIEGQHTSLSGINMVLSSDVVKFILHHQDRFSYNCNEDTETSALINMNIKCFHKCMKRIDFISDAKATPMILYHKCVFYDDALCFRFKSDNR